MHNNIKKNNNEEENIEIISSSYKSLGPTCEADKYDLFEKILIKKLEETNTDNSIKNKNIAITGLYGSGKSSMIKTFITKNDKYKYITISLGKYSNESNNLEKNVETNVENSLLQQIIYNARPNDLPFSRITRSDIDFKKNNKYAAIISFLLMIIVIISNYNYLISIFNDNIYSEIYPFQFFILLFLCSFTIYYILYFIIKKIKLYSYIKRIVIRGNEIELDENTTSVLSKSIDELIHFFMIKKYNVVIIEDVDRLKNSVEIFTKLKEINFIINSSIKNKTIRFIYEINDSIFDDSEHRTKFFDVIIPVVSYTAPIVSNEMLNELFLELFGDDLKEIIDRKDFIYISSYIDNSRVVYDIYNEFSIYYYSNKLYLDNKKIRNLYYLVSYKVLFPKRFDNYLKNKGALAYRVSEDYKKDFVNYYKSKKNKEFNSKLDDLESKIKQKNEELQKKLEKSIDDLSNNNDLIFYDNNDNKIFVQDEFNNNKENCIIALYNNNVIAKNDSSTYLEDNLYPSKSKEKFFNEYFNSDIDRDRFNLLEDISKLNSISYYDIKDNELEKEFNSNNYSSDSFDKYKLNSNKIQSNVLFYMENEYEKLNSFEDYLISNSFIDNFSTIFLTIQNGAFDKVVDKFLLNELIKDVIYDVDTVINNPKDFISMFSKELIKKDSFCLSTIYKEIKNNKDYVNIIFDNLSALKLKNILKMDNFNNELLSNDNLEKIWKYIENNDIDKDVVNYYIVKTIECGDSNKINNECFYKIVNNEENIDDLFEINYSGIERNYKSYKFDLKQNKFNHKNTKFMNYLYDNELFNSNINLFNSILLSKGYKINDSKLLESYYNCNNESVNKYVENNIISIIDYINDKKYLQKDKDKVIIKVIELLGNDYEYVNILLSKEEKNIGNIEGLNDLYPIIDETNKYSINIANLNRLFQHYKEKSDKPISDSMKENINTKYNDIFSIRYNKNYKEMIFYIITNIDIILPAFKYISDYYFSNNEIIEDKEYNIPSANVEYLIMSGYIYGNIEKIKDKYKNGSNDIAKKYFENSFVYLNVEKNENFIQSSNMLNDIFDFNNIDYKNKLDFVINYTDLFDNKTYNNIFQIIFNNKYNNLDVKILIDCLKNHNNIKEVVDCIVKYKDKLNYNDVCTILDKNNDFKKLITSKKNANLKLSIYSKTFIDWFCKISDEKFLVNRYDGNKAYINHLSNN